MLSLQPGKPVVLTTSEMDSPMMISTDVGAGATNQDHSHMIDSESDYYYSSALSVSWSASSKAQAILTRLGIR